jgi:type IV pilus assembly protein PilF
MSLKRLGSFLLILFCMTACTTMHNDGENVDKKIATAKINVQLGMAYLARQDIQRAKMKLMLAAEEAPSLPDVWYAMGYFHEVTGDKALAKNDYLKALSLAPDKGEVQNNYGTFLCRSGNYEESIKHFILATKDKDYINTSDAYENAGLCALKIPNLELAMHYFQAAVASDPNHPLSYLELAELNYQNKNYVEAQQYLNSFLNLAPASPQSILLGEKLAKQVKALPVKQKDLLHNHMARPYQDIS